MGIFRKSAKRQVRTADQPDATFRRESEASEQRYQREHELTTESPRFNDAPEASEAERGFPSEGEPESTGR